MCSCRSQRCMASLGWVAELPPTDLRGQCTAERRVGRCTLCLVALPIPYPISLFPCETFEDRHLKNY